MPKAKRTKSGSWSCVACYTNEYGERKQKRFTAATKNLAELNATQFLEDRKIKKQPTNKTFGEMLDAYIDYRTNSMSPSTITGYRKIRRNAFNGIVDIRIGLLTAERYQAEINNYAKGHSPKTVREAHTLAHRALTMNKIDIADNINLPQAIYKEKQIPTDKEVKAFLDYLLNNQDRLYLLVAFAAYLGLRRSEIVALKWEDIDLEKKQVRINKARVKDEFGSYVEKTTKTVASTRTLIMPQVLIDALPAAGAPKDYVIDDSIDALDSLYKRTAKKAGFPYSFHALRHYYASVLLAMGMPNKYAQKRMGHSTDLMLREVYQHLFPEVEEEFDRGLDSHFASLAPTLEAKKEDDEK